MAKRYVSNKDETVRMFRSDFLEFLSRVHFTIPLFVYLPVIGYFIYKGLFVFHLTYLSATSYFFFGIFIWSFAEYVLHRFVFHYCPPGEWGRRIHFVMHGVHHDYPSDSKRLVMPPGVSIPLAVGFYYLFLLLMPGYMLPVFYSGFLFGYLIYDMTHYAIHHFNMHSKFWLAIKNHHMRHHYGDSHLGFGVSSSLWDYVFRTMFRK